MTTFYRVQLRTRDVEAARAFYATALGRERLHVVQLHEQAVARGARPHWLGLLQVDDVARALAFFTERGGAALGPVWTNPEGLEGVTLRDPGGAVVGLAKPPSTEAASAPDSDAGVVGYTLNTTDVEGAKASYAARFGWELAPPVDLGELGVVHPFAWRPGLPPAGVMLDVEGRRGVHPHWLFHFGVAALDAAMEAIEAAGGEVVATVTPPAGARVAVCEDPQGAAFAIQERPGI